MVQPENEPENEPEFSPETATDPALKVTFIWVASIVLGLCTGAGSFLLAAGLVMRFAPRDSEGVRSVVADWSWEYFAFLPTILAALPVLVLAAVAYFCNFGTRASRLLWLIAAILALYVGSEMGIPLLRRDFIGKF